MAKFTTDYVNLIANNLRDRYKTGFPILKELVQNADDAGACSLAFGYHAEFGPAADHMLLQGPALWVLNDGRFLPSDRESIHSFGLNGKAAESGAIGKFGLGMKSVFHLCESFFYMAKGGQNVCTEILNPWIQDEGGAQMHLSWETITERDLACLRQVVDSQEEARPDATWFMLWVPLRKRDHIATGDGHLNAAIIDRFPGDSDGQDLDFFTERNIDRRIGSLLPLLRSLRRVRFSGTGSVPEFHVALETSDGVRRLDHETDGIRMSGLVLDDRTPGEHLRFHALQCVPGPRAPFTELLACASWPKSMAIVDSGRRAQVPDKARPEGTIVLSHADRRDGRFTLQWAVFLPTEEGRFSYETRIPDSSRDYSILLHGQFFVDAGRRGIADMDALHVACQPLAPGAAQPLVLRQWNQALAQDIVLPGLLPALDEYVRVHKLKDEEVQALTGALRECTAAGDAGSRVGFFATFRTHVCRDHAWVRCLDRSGRRWTLVRQPGRRLLPLPAPPAVDPERPWRALPGLERIDSTTFVDSAAPNLAAALANWDEDLLLGALAGLTGQTLKDERELTYLVQFLEMEADRQVRTGRIQDELVRQIRRALNDVSLVELRQNRSMFKRLVALLTTDRRFALGTRDPAARGALSEAAFRKLVHCATRALLVPGDLAPDGDASAANDEDLCAWLESIAVMPGGRPLSASTTPGVWLDLAETVIAAAGNQGSQIDLLRRNARLSILKAVDGRGGKIVAISLQGLAEAHHRGWLFKVSDPSRPQGFVTRLAAAVEGVHPLTVRAALAPVVESVSSGPTRRVPGSEDAAALLRVAGAEATAPPLGAPAARRDLLSLVAGAGLDDPLVVRGVRYLLHGSVEHYLGSESLWKDPVGQGSPWVRLWQMVDDAPWRILADELCGSIPDQCAKALNIKAVDEASVLARLRVCTDFSGVDAAAFTPYEIDMLLGRVQDEFPWRRLPLHRNSDGRYGNAEGSCFLGRVPELPAGITHGHVFFDPSNDPAHLRRQKEVLPQWSGQSAASTVLRSTSPASHWSYLMDLLVVEPSLIERAPSDWHSVAWLPLAIGGSIAPGSLVRLDFLDAEIGDLARKCRYAYAGTQDLAAEVRSHPAYATLHARISTGEEALPVLGQMMSEAGLTVGSCVRRRFGEVGRYLATLVSIKSLPAWAVLERAAAGTSIDAVGVHLLPELVGQLPMPVCVRVLGEISSLAADDSVQAVFSVYLEEWRSSEEPPVLRDSLHGLVLPSAAGTWAPATQLVTGVSGVMPRFLLNGSLLGSLAGVAVDNRTAPTMDPGALADVASGVPGDRLRQAVDEYFEPLSASSVRQAVGAVIGLFGVDFAALATNWLAPLAYEDYLEKLNWKDPGREAGGDRRVNWMGQRSLAQALEMLTIRISVLDGTHLRARSLTGAEVDVEVEPPDDLKSLYLKSDSWQGYACRVVLRPATALLGREPPDQRDILMRTAESMLKDLYNQPHANLTGLFALVEEADQVTLDVARGLILEGLPQSLRALPGIGRNRKLAQALERLDLARRDVASARRTGREGARDKLDEALVELASLVESDPQVQATVLKGIKGKVADSQYEPASIPFEIFQNADDAVAEMQQLQLADERCEFDAEAIGRFVVATADRVIRFAHWGRPINYPGRLANYKPDFANDLERMLMLGASAKIDEDGVTGKFGLGFKSVLLASSNPRVWSGDLCFDIVAGCLPSRWRPGPATHEFQYSAQTQGQRTMRSTLVELPLDTAGAEREIVDRFAGLAGLLPVFAHRLRVIVVDGHSHTWNPQVRNLGHGVQREVGLVSVPVKGGHIHTRLLVLRTAKGAVAMRLGASGVEAFDRDARPGVPCLWVTAPTRGTPAGGVLINAPFQIDTGRATVAAGKTATRTNMDLVELLAREIAPALADMLVESETDWPELSGQLDCAPDVSAADFWTSLWAEMLAEPPADDAAMDVKLADRFACSLLAMVVQRTGRVPNGIKGDAAAMVDVDGIRLSIDLAYLGGALQPLRQWNSFVERYPADGWCTDAVAGWLERSGSLGTGEIPSLSRAQVIEAIPHGRLSPEDIASLADVQRTWPRSPGEAYGWRSDMAQLRFSSRAGSWSLPRELLRAGSLDDETLGGFAPDKAVLEASYRPDSAAFAWIEQYLSPGQFDAATLAGWCIRAEGALAQAAAVRWLSRHIYDQVVDELRARRHLGGWLFELTSDSGPLGALDAPERTLLLEKLGLANGGEDHALTRLSPRLDLEALHAWWTENDSRWLGKFDQNLWPAAIDRNALLKESPHDRSAWMTLFSLGLFRRYGRVTDQQHRGFLEFLERRGWWQTICEVDPDSGADAWMGILRAYGESQQAETLFELWMDSFPRIYRVARWLDTYVHLFSSLDLRDSRLAPFLLSPASDPSLSGSGLDAPTLSGMLRLGQHLVVRELLRVGVLNSAVARQYAYAPGRAVVELMAQLGHPGLHSSTEIHAALVHKLGEDGANFGGAYDIPLQLVAGNAQARLEAEAWADGSGNGDHATDQALETP